MTYVVMVYIVIPMPTHISTRMPTNLCTHVYAHVCTHATCMPASKFVDLRVHTCAGMCEETRMLMCEGVCMDTWYKHVRNNVHRHAHRHVHRDMHRQSFLDLYLNHIGHTCIGHSYTAHNCVAHSHIGMPYSTCVSIPARCANAVTIASSFACLAAAATAFASSLACHRYGYCLICYDLQGYGCHILLRVSSTSPSNTGSQGPRTGPIGYNNKYVSMTDMSGLLSRR